MYKSFARWLKKIVKAANQCFAEQIMATTEQLNVRAFPCTPRCVEYVDWSRGYFMKRIFHETKFFWTYATPCFWIFTAKMGEGVKLDQSRLKWANTGPDWSKNVQNWVFSAHFGFFRSDKMFLWEAWHTVFKRRASLSFWATFCGIL